MKSIQCSSCNRFVPAGSECLGCGKTLVSVPQRAYQLSQYPEPYSDPVKVSSSTGTERDFNFVDATTMPVAPPKKPRREPIPRAATREVWQRDGGMCVECGSKENLCFDHIIPFSRGGSNVVRNLQLLCVKCNLSKAAKI
jgi:5-methylcytosine-specific restriction endonuclease McrA